jgi:hypothetical protein
LRQRNFGFRQLQQAICPVTYGGLKPPDKARIPDTFPTLYKVKDHMPYLRRMRLRYELYVVYRLTENLDVPGRQDLSTAELHLSGLRDGELSGMKKILITGFL